MEEIYLEIITPEKTVLKEKIESVVVPSHEGYLGILKNHAEAILQLQIGKLKFKKEGKENYVAISSGFLKVENNKVKIFTSSAEKKEEIDRERAEKAKMKAEERIKSKEKEIDIARAESALKRALNRIKVAS